MVRAAVIFALSAAVPLVAAQSIQVPALPFNLSYTPDLNKVSADRRSDWCNGERAVCDTLCGAPDTYPTTNDCDPATLKYACTCQNGTAPGLQYYHNSLPTFICEEAFDQCITASVGDRSGQDKCQTGVRSQCGTLNAQDAKTGGSTTSASASGTPSATQSGASSTPTSSKAPNAAVQTQMPNLAGVGLAAVMLGVFAL